MHRDCLTLLFLMLQYDMESSLTNDFKDFGSAKIYKTRTISERDRKESNKEKYEIWFLEKRKSLPGN